jgi:transposase/transposase-like protein
MVSRAVRAQAIQAYLHGEGSMQAVADRFGMRQQTLFRWIAQFRHTGEVPFRRRGRACRFSEHDRWVLLSLLQAEPTATARSLAQSFATATGQTRPGTSTVHLTLLESGLIWDGVWHLPQGGLPPLPPEPAREAPPATPEEIPPAVGAESTVSPPQLPLPPIESPPSSGCRLPTQPSEPEIAHPTREAYPSDLSDAEWAILQPLLEKSAPIGRPREVPLREILNALRYMARSGCTWRAIPHDLPSWKVVAKTYYRWIADQTWDRLNASLRLHIRKKAGKKEQPTAALVDSQSVKTAGPGEEQGYNGGKKIKGRKRHILVDTLGMVLAVVVHTAG